MQSSGLRQFLCLVYPDNTVSHMLTGKAVYRAMRGYFLVDAALNIFIIKNDLFKDEKYISHFIDMFEDTLKSKDEKKAINDEAMTNICRIFKDVKENLKVRPTGKLWIQFMDQMDNLKISHRAQRTGNFLLY